jgi:hypothetical protein
VKGVAHSPQTHLFSSFSSLSHIGFCISLSTICTPLPHRSQSVIINPSLKHLFV